MLKPSAKKLRPAVYALKLQLSEYAEDVELHTESKHDDHKRFDKASEVDYDSRSSSKAFDDMPLMDSEEVDHDYYGQVDHSEEAQG
eukprot:CAMPEP_0204897506 /NCGR_PEP_ID=MMETSP1397-20131031/780_1 /ASSEMBLY_ACC=CAM_ASM_000891 /TAXON_ID=49980 /ORGANISM="Climacostomum Climacostomum virens, Strain Stock W-24" /LENGTH=85 /DNA_ID=CAMNT_0052065273 /DNA_START=474 /DNA_END=730 /DNA_ORIENTATION=+